MSLKMNSVSVYASGTRLISNISMECETGSVVGILGENGAGKSTVLNSLSGANVPDAGRVTLSDQLISRYSLTELASRRAVLPQSSDLSFPLNAIEVVRLALSMASYPYQKQDALLMRCLNQFGVSHLADRSYPNLSGGEKQRIQLARVLAQLKCHSSNERTDDQFLLLDEPISALDLHQQFKTMRHIRELTKDGIGVVVILHDLNLASMFCDHLIILKEGTLLTQGTPHDVITTNTINQAFDIDVDIALHPDTRTPFLTPRLL